MRPTRLLCAESDASSSVDFHTFVQCEKFGFDFGRMWFRSDTASVHLVGH